MATHTEHDDHRPDPLGLLRPRLLAPLVHPDGPGVVVVIAPPGSGKTTLLARAVAECVGPAVWCAARPEDCSGPELVRHLARAAAEALGQDLGVPRTAADLLGKLRQRAGAPVLLVLDDVHELIGSAAEQEVADLVRGRPRNVRIALGTRRPLTLNTPRLMVSGELVELDSEALRFRSWEVEELFRTLYREPLSPEGAAALTRRTGGWAAGLMLFHLSTTGKSAVARERAVADLGGRSRLLRSYLTRTVLDELDPQRRHFLLATSTLGTLRAPLCDALLGRDDSAGVLEDLASRQFFTTLDENGQSYRYHQVLQTLLEGLLVDECGRRRALELYARSAALLESDGLTREALRAHAMAEDFASVARLLQRASPGLAVDARIAAVQKETDDPWLVLVRARRLHRAGAFADAVAAFHEAEAQLDDGDFRQRCNDESAMARVWLPDVVIPAPRVAAGTTSCSLGQTVRAATRRLPAPDRVPPPPLAAGAVQLLSGEVGQAARTLARVVAGSPPEQLCADLARVVAEIAAGAGEDSVTTLEQVVLTAELEEQPWLARVARGLQAAVLLVETGDPWRAESCASMVEACESSGDTWGAVLLAGALGVARALQQDAEAVRWLDRATRSAVVLDAPVLAAWSEHVAAAVAQRQGLVDAPDRMLRARAQARATGLTEAEAVLGSRLASGAVRPAGVALRCLGPFAIEVAGREVRLPPLRPLPRRLLLLLVLHHGRAVHREVLIDLLWPGTPVEAAAHRLHAAASSVRRCLAEAGLGEAVQRSGSAYTLLVEGATLDVTQFEAALRRMAQCDARGDHEQALQAGVEALDVYQGDLLTEAGPEEWVVAERDRLRVAAANAAYCTGRLSLRLRTSEEALRLARRALDLDPLRDSAWTLLAEVQEGMGDLGSAAATRREHALVATDLAER